MSKIGKYLALKPWRQEALAASFWGRVDKTSLCWLWTGSRNGGGYGLMNIQWKAGAEAAHRISYFLHFGEIPDGMVIMHVCDNPACVNPEHLRLGTNADNARDCAMKGRTFRSIGSKSGKAKLTEGLVLHAMNKIAAGLSFKAAAKECGVSHFTLRRIEDGSRWPHLQKAVRSIFSARRPVDPEKSHPWKDRGRQKRDPQLIAA